MPAPPRNSASQPDETTDDTDWHACIDGPAQGPLGYCTGTDAPFTATAEKTNA
ncbi:hypothetical protein ACFVWY_34455 [Streptomyces sp. NPDC058195]|uniref:hypothetical protein n=1 Tax=Streptomyces sp. NPDC058195 TaxID=3346375 RepID=UPI0036EFC6CC